MSKPRPDSGRVVFEAPAAVDYFDEEDDIDEDDWDAQLIIEQSAYEPKHLHEPGPLAMTLQGILGNGAGASSHQQSIKGGVGVSANNPEMAQTVPESLLEYLESTVLKEMFPDFAALNDTNSFFVGDGSDGGGSKGNHSDSHETLGIQSNRGYGEPTESTQKNVHQSFSAQKHLKGFPEWLLSTCPKLKSSIMLTPYSHDVNELLRRARLASSSAAVSTSSRASDLPAVSQPRLAKNARAAYIASYTGTEGSSQNAENAVSDVLYKMAQLGASARVLLEVDANQTVGTQEDGDNDLNLDFYDSVLQRCEEDPTKDECVAALEDVTRWIRSLCHTQPSPTVASSPAETVRTGTGTVGGGGGVQSVRDSGRPTWYESFRLQQSPGANLPRPPPPPETAGTLSASEVRDARDRDTIELARGAASAPLRPSDLFKGISHRKYDKIFSSCDFILHELSQFTTGRILQLYSILLNGIESLPPSPSPLNKALLLDPELATAVSEMMQHLTRMVHICRIKIQMLEIKIHVNLNVDLFSILQNLRYIADELQTINDAWLRTLFLFLRSDEEAQIRSSGLDGSNHSKQSSASQHTAAGVSKDEYYAQNSSGSPVAGSSLMPYSQRHGEILQKVLADLQGLCVADTLLMVCRISPITFRKLQDSAGIHSWMKSKDVKRGRPKSRNVIDADDDDRLITL
jgi:hypothetical protein